MNALGTEFNVLYNGQLALDKGLKELDEGYHDNFYERIPIEPLKVDEKLTCEQGNRLLDFLRSGELVQLAIRQLLMEQKLSFRLALCDRTELPLRSYPSNRQMLLDTSPVPIRRNS